MDWIQNLQELQWIIVTTFPFLKSIAYLMRIDDTIIDNSDPQRLGNLIRIASSVPVIELIQNPNAETYFTITAHSNSDQTIEYPLSSNKREWTSKVYDDLLCSIAKAFGVPNHSRLSIYESIGNHRLFLDDIGDIKSAFDDRYNPNKQSLNVKILLKPNEQIETANNGHPAINLENFILQ
eukprot:503997_1